MKPLETLALAAILAASTGTWGADAPGKPMRMDEPMRGEMKKKGMKKGDVKKAAEKKGREKKPVIEREMPGPAKK